MLTRNIATLRASGYVKPCYGSRRVVRRSDNGLPDDRRRRRLRSRARRLDVHGWLPRRRASPLSFLVASSTAPSETGTGRTGTRNMGRSSPTRKRGRPRASSAVAVVGRARPTAAWFYVLRSLDDRGRPKLVWVQDAKTTWLLTTCDRNNLPEIPFVLRNVRDDWRHYQLMSRKQRAETTRAFAEFLVEIARRSVR